MYISRYFYGINTGKQMYADRKVAPLFLAKCATCVHLSPKIYKGQTKETIYITYFQKEMRTVGCTTEHTNLNNLDTKDFYFHSLSFFVYICI